MRRIVSIALCASISMGMVQPALALHQAQGNPPASVAADPFSLGYGVQTPAGDGVTAFNGEPITYTINLVNLTGATINNISVFDPLPEDTLDNLNCSPACGQSITTRSIPDPLGGVIQVTRTLAVSWFVPALAPGAGAGVQLQLVARVIGRMAGTSFSSSAIATYDGGAVGSNAVQVTVAARPRNSSSARVENAPVWFSSDAGGTTDMDWGDVNRDGALDLALASSIGTSVYRNNKGLLTRIWSVPQMSYGARWADVNNDGLLELVVVGDSDDKTAQTAGRNRIYKYNTGSGNLSLMSEFTSTRQLVRVTTGDLNGDGFIDLIGSTNAIAVDCAVPIFLNNGAGLFTYSQSTCLTSNATAAISLGDMNNDNKLDLALGAFPNNINIKVNGSITSMLQASSTITIESDLSFLPYDFSWGDFDSDGYLDLAMAFPLDRQARIYHNVANGPTRSFVLQQILPSLNFLTPFSVDWADIAGDGNLDLVVSGSPATVYVRNAAGRFVLKADLSSNIGGGQVWRARAAETQPDEGVNLVFTNRDSASMMFDVIAPRLSPDIQAAFGTDVLNASDVALADLDSNGFLDMIQGADGGAVRTRAFLNIDNGFPGFSVFSTLLGPQGIAVGDINSDNALEVAIGDRTQLGLYTANGSLLRSIVVPAAGPYVPAWGDANDDGLLDLFVMSNGPAFVYINNAGVLASAPAFQTPESCTPPGSTSTSNRSIAVMDVTGDRYMDFVVGCFGQPARLYRNNQNETYTLIWTAPASTPTTDVGLSDFNADGWPDLAIANDGQPVQVYENIGGTFAASPIWNSGTTNRTLSIAWGDWDNDGYPELAAASLGAPLDVYANLDSKPGKPQLQRVWRSNLSANFTSVAWGDIDNDGDLDLVSTGTEAAASGIFENAVNDPFQYTAPGEPAKQVELPRAPVYVSIHRPGKISDAFFNSSSEFLTNPNVANVPVTFTVYGADGSRNSTPVSVPVQGLVYEYSVDGGSTWTAATPATTTVPITQVTRAGTVGMFLWNARADKAISDNTHFRVRAISKAPTGPVQRASASAITPPFRVRSTTCFWADTAGVVYTPTLPVENQAILFAGGQVGGSGQITFSWQFGDGKSTIGQLAVHSYTVAGAYNVSLTVLGAACPITRPLTIAVPVTVSDGPRVYKVALPFIANSTPTRTLNAALQTPALAIDLSQQVTGLDGVTQDGMLQLIWQPPAAAQPDGYRIYRTTAEAGRVPLADVPAGQTGLAEEAPPCGAAYDVVWLNDGSESSSAATNYYTAPCVAAVKQPAAGARPPRFNLKRATQAAASPAAAITAQPSLAPLTAPAPTLTMTCDLPASVLPNTGSLISINSQPALSARGNLVAFWSTGNLDPRGRNSDGSIELYVAGPLTGTFGAVTMTQVTSSSGSILGGFNLWPSVSADGAKLAFSSDRDLVGQNPDSNFETFIAQLGPARSITLAQISNTASGVSLVPSLSADGAHVAFASDGNFTGGNADRSLEIFIAHLAGASVVSYTQATSSPAIILNDLPSLSENGQRAAFVQREFNETTDVVSQTVMAWLGDIGPASLITIDTTATDPRPALSSNGRYVAYVHSDLPDGPYLLKMFDLANPNTPAIDLAYVVRECKPFISRNGDRAGCVNASSILAIYSPGRPVVITAGDVSNNAQPALASAGDVVAYITSNDQIALVTCRSADLALVLPVTNTTPTKAGTVVTMSVPASNLGPSASPTTTLHYTLTSPIGEKIFVDGKAPAPTVTGSLTYTGIFAADAVYTFTLPLSTTENTQVNMAWHIEGAADDTDPANNDGTSSITMQSDVRFAIALQQTSVPAQNVRAGDSITYSIVLTNIGVSRASGVRITDTLSAETSFVTFTTSTSNAVTGTVICAAPPTTTLGSTLPCILTGSRLPGQNQGVITLTLTAQVTDTALGPLSNVVSATATELVGIMSKTLTTTVLPQVDLRVSTVVTPANPVAGQVATFTLTISNAGLIGVPVEFTTTLPGNATYLHDPLSGWSLPDGNNRITASGFMPAQQSAPMSFSVFVSDDVATGTDLIVSTYLTSSNLIGANPTGFDPDPGNNTDVFTATVDRVSDVQVALDATPAVVAGQAITYFVTFTNAGPSVADLVTVTVSAPLLEPSQLVITTALGVGMTGTAALPATVGSGNYTPTLASTANITSTNTDNDLGNNTSVFTSSVTASADVNAQIVTAPPSVIAGNNITYTITYSNPGPSDAQNATVVFSATGAVSFTAPAGWVKVNETQLSRTLAVLSSGISETVTITGVVPAFAAPGSFINSRLEAGSTTPDPNPSNNVDTDSAQVDTKADLGVRVTAPVSAVAGTLLTYTVSYSNAGPSNAINAQVQLSSPFNVVALPGGTFWITTSANIASLTQTPVVPGAAGSDVITVSVPASASAGASVANASVNATTSDLNSLNNTDSASVNITRSVDLSITVLASPSTNNSTDYAYTVLLYNAGPSDLPSQRFTVNWTPKAKVLLAVSPGWASTPAAPNNGVANAEFTNASALPAGASTTAIITITTPKKGASLSAAFVATTPGAVDPANGNNTFNVSTALDPVLVNAITLTAGSNTVLTGTGALFTATIGPINATWPVTYKWSASNQIPPQTTVITDDDVSTFVFTWTTLGPQIVTVTAVNGGAPVTATRLITVTPVAVSGLSINAADTVQIGALTALTATASPANATLPIAFNWSGTNQGAQSTPAGGLADTKQMSWTVLGPQIVTVTAVNGGAPFTATRLITVTPINLSIVSLAAATTITQSGRPFTFTANVLPANATMPITYTWSATGQSIVVQAGGGLSAQQVFTWSTPGTQAVIVTATNAGNAVTATLLVTVTPIAMTSLTMSSPVTTALGGTAFNFTANALPANASTPVTYTWSASGQAPQVQTGGGLSSLQAFTWITPGIQGVSVTANNGGPILTATFTVTVTPIALTSVSITPPGSVISGALVNFLANAAPLNVSLPLTYTWTATNQAGSVVNGSINGTSNAVAYVWPITGSQTVTVVVSNAYGNVVTNTVGVSIP